MRRPSKVLGIVGVLFLLWGLFWAVLIYQRDVRLAPKPAAQATLFAQFRETVRSYGGELALSPSSVALFWALACWEVLAAGCFVAAGIALLRAYPFGRGLALTALALDVLFKGAVIGYMHWIAAPLAHALHRGNVLSAYFAPYPDSWLTASRYTSGLKMFEPHGFLFMIVYGVLVAAATAVLLTARPRAPQA